MKLAMFKRDRNTDNLQVLNWETTDITVFQKQFFSLVGLMLLVLALYACRMWYLQVLQGPIYRYQSENNRIRLEEVPAARGIIFDRNGNPLVENRPAYHLQLIREDVQDLEQTVREVARLCERTPEELHGVIESSRNSPKFVPLRLVSDIDRECLARVEAQRIRLPGIFVQLEPKREYRWLGTAPHLIGYLSEITESELKSEQYQGYFPAEDVGRIGVEGGFEKYLHGKRGGRQVEVDAIGRRIRLLDEVLPVSGKNVWLTIDIQLQKVAEACLEGRTGAIVALDPNNGAVLAMASSPGFDQEKFIRGMKKEEWQTLTRDRSHPLLNRGISGTYPPGSTYKPLVALAALKEGAVTPDTAFFCPGYLEFADRRYRCWRDHGHGSVSMVGALIQSCDVYFYQCGLRVGVDRLAHWVKAFGLGEKTAIGIPGESAGLVPTSWWKKQAMGVPWQKGETLSIAIGQGFDSATPLQMTLAYAAIANNGKVWQPYVVRRIEGHGPDEVDEIKGKLKGTVAMEQRYFDVVKKGLLGVVESEQGTAHHIKDKTITIAGKTGTAQVVQMADGINRKLAGKVVREKRDHAWFVGYAPANNPQIVVTALVEHGEHGSSTAAPLVKEVIMAYLNNASPAPGS